MFASETPCGTRASETPRRDLHETAPNTGSRGTMPPGRLVCNVEGCINRVATKYGKRVESLGMCWGHYLTWKRERQIKQEVPQDMRRGHAIKNIKALISGSWDRARTAPGYSGITTPAHIIFNLNPNCPLGVPPRCELTGLPCKPHADHDHYTGDFRAWLHPQINLFIGSLGDTPDSLRKAAETVKHDYGDFRFAACLENWANKLDMLSDRCRTVSP